VARMFGRAGKKRKMASGLRQHATAGTSCWRYHRRLRRLGRARPPPTGFATDPFADDPATRRRRWRLSSRTTIGPAGADGGRGDLADLAVYEALLAHRGIRGLWSVATSVSKTLSRLGHAACEPAATAHRRHVRPHEPAYDPNRRIRHLDYCRGYATPRSTKRRQTPTDSTGATERASFSRALIAG